MQLLPSLFRAPMCIPEMDLSGTVVACGSSVPRSLNLPAGTKVFGSVPVGQHAKGSGALAEYVAVDPTSVVGVDGVKGEEVAGLAIAGTTALELVKAASLKIGDSVLVNGASGGIGHLVVQMCKNIVGESGRVVAVCSTANVVWVKDLGADEVCHIPLNMKD